jgi:hypothetical protein
MSKMGDLLIEIEDLLASGYDANAIATKTGMPLDWIMEYIDNYDRSEYNDCMDGDFDSAMSSAGFGTDEDYGSVGNDDFS